MNTPNPTSKDDSTGTVATGMTSYDLGRYVLDLLGKNAPIVIIAMLAVYSYGVLEDTNQLAQKQLQEDLESARQRVQNSYTSITEFADWQTSSIDTSLDLQDKMQARLQKMQEGIGVMQQSLLLRQSQETLRSTIRYRIDGLRNLSLGYLDNKWTPAYIEDWVKEGRLRDVAAGKVVWDDNAGDFVLSASVDDQEARLFDTILAWTDAALNDIADKRAELIKPLDELEERLMQEANNIDSPEEHTAILQALSSI